MPVYITPKKTKKGTTRHRVRYRLGGRAYPLVHAGSFATQKEAKLRRDLVAGEIAAGRNPQVLLNALLDPPAPVKVETLNDLGPRYLTSRIDLDAKTERSHRSALERIYAWGGDRDPQSLTWGDCQEFIGTLVDGIGELKPISPASIRKYYNVLKILLDFVEVEPNPARDKRVKLPAIQEREPDPPTGRQFLTILDSVPSEWVLPFVMQEQTGMHIGELLQVTWGDVDVAERKIRLRFEYVKAGIRARARTVQVPGWLMEALEVTCALEDRVAERKLFLGLNEDKARRAMRNACKAGKIPHFTPKSLRHRRATIWHHGGVVATQLAARLGHTKASMSLDVYSHTVDPGEIALEELQARVAGGG